MKEYEHFCETVKQSILKARTNLYLSEENLTERAKNNPISDSHFTESVLGLCSTQ